jgi:integrase
MSDEGPYIMNTLPALPGQMTITEVEDQSSGSLANKYADATKQTRYTEELTDNTTRRQKADLKLFFKYLQAAKYEYPIADFHDLLDAGQTENAWSLWQGVTYGHVEAFIQWQKTEGYAVGSINTRLSTIKAYCRLAHSAHVLSLDDDSRISRIKSIRHKAGVTLDKSRPVKRRGLKKEEPTLISPAHAALLKRQKRAKDAVMMCILLDLGLRCSELAQLKVSDINIREGMITFYREKVDITQKHRLTPDCLSALLVYLPTVKGVYLLPGHKHVDKETHVVTERHMNTSGINKRVGELGKAIGIDDLSPHDLRHYLITEEAAKGTDSNTLQQMGGWSSPAMALKYMTAGDVANAGASFFKQQ